MDSNNAYAGSRLKELMAKGLASGRVKRPEKVGDTVGRSPITGSNIRPYNNNVKASVDTDNPSDSLRNEGTPKVPGAGISRTGSLISGLINRSRRTAGLGNE